MRKPACTSGREPTLTAHSKEGGRTPGLGPRSAEHGRAHSPPGVSGPSTLTWPMTWKHSQGCFLSVSPHTRRLSLRTPSAGGIASVHGTHSQAGLGHGAGTVSPQRTGKQETCRPMGVLSEPNHTSEGMKVTRLNSQPYPPRLLLILGSLVGGWSPHPQPTGSLRMPHPPVRASPTIKGMSPPELHSPPAFWLLCALPPQGPSQQQSARLPCAGRPAFSLNTTRSLARHADGPAPCVGAWRPREDCTLEALPHWFLPGHKVAAVTPSGHTAAKLSDAAWPRPLPPPGVCDSGAEPNPTISNISVHL